MKGAVSLGARLGGLFLLVSSLINPIPLTPRQACAHTIAEVAKPGQAIPPLPANAGDASIANLESVRHANGGASAAELRLEMQKVMQNHAAVFRDGPTLQEGVTKMKHLYNEMVSSALFACGV